MKKEIRKMYLWAIIKMLFALLVAGAFILVFSETDEMVAVITCSILWGIVVIIYLLSGIFTIKNGTKQLKEYIANTSYNMEQLDEEYKNAKKISRLHVGDKHVFVNASDGFYVFPLSDISDVEVIHKGYNYAKGRNGYYYLYIEVKNIKHKLKVHYISKKNANSALECLKKNIGKY